VYKSSDVRIVHLEVTSLCNAGCPMCPRHVDGKVNPDLPLEQLTLDDVRRILPAATVRALDKVYLCGGYGDAIAARETLEILAYLRAENPSLRLGIHTNGGARSAAWWREVAALRAYGRFAIDGLEDTNHVYRIGVRWDVLMRNVEAFIGAGGAEWVFIVFAHNEHQVDSAHDLSRALGFRRFDVKTSSRFFDAERAADRHWDVLDETGSVAYTLSPPHAARHRHPAVVRADEIVRRHGSVRAYHQSCEIACKAVADRSVYVTAGGLVFPCCWLGGDLYTPRRPMRTRQIWQVLSQLTGGERALDGRIGGIAAIVDGPFFQQTVREGWQPGDRRLLTCGGTCASGLNRSDAQLLERHEHRITSRRRT